MGEDIKAAPDQGGPPITDDDNGRAIVFMPWTAVPRYRERIHPVPISQPVLRVGSGDAVKSVSRVRPRRDSRRRRATCPFPHYHFLAMAVEQSTLAHRARQVGHDSLPKKETQIKTRPKLADACVDDSMQ